jgi:hypothetical protein
MLRDRVLEAQQKDVEVSRIKDKVKLGVETSYHILKDGMIVLKRRIYLLGDKTLKKEILQEAHELRLTTHPVSSKIYPDFKEFYRWSNMKKEVVEYMEKCRIYQQVKVKH